MKELEINPLAILAAVLFNAGKSEKIKIKTNDSGEEVEIERPCIGVEEEEDALLCIMPIEKLIYFMQVNYNFKFRLDDGHAIFTFEKQSAVPTLVNANGEQLSGDSPAIQRLMERIK